MENLVNYKNQFGGIYQGVNVLLTGDSGFKGSWLKFWLEKLGANVSGLSLSPNTVPNHQTLLFSDTHNAIDINNIDHVTDIIKQTNPQIVFHLAAQPLVRYSYKNPLETWNTNIIGTANLLYALKEHAPNCKAIVNVTTDKCYENKEWDWSYREIDPLGGFDPYSSSKACSEIITASFRNSFFNIDKFNQEHSTLIATSRAGNVIGGGDWSEDRLIPDIIKATINKEKVIIRSPQSVRPWQHVLEPLTAYLILGQKLFEGKVDFSDAWNIGPDTSSILSVNDILNISNTIWPQIKFEVQNNNEVHEAQLLMLDSSKSIKKLKWSSVWDCKKAIKKTIDWYRNYYENDILNTEKDLNDYINDAKLKGSNWT